MDKINDSNSSDRMSSDNKDEMRMVRQVKISFKNNKSELKVLL
jgi:hypothetical protein